MFGKKSTHAEPVVAHWDPHALAVLDRIETRLDRLELLVRDSRPAPAAQSAQVQGPHHSEVQSWLPVLDRMQELAMIALGHPDLAQQFGLTARQKEADRAAGPTTWTEPDEPTPEGVTYG